MLIDFIESIGIISIAIFIAFLILIIALIRAIFNIAENTKQTNEKLEEISEQLKKFSEDTGRNHAPVTESPETKNESNKTFEIYDELN